MKLVKVRLIGLVMRNKTNLACCLLLIVLIGSKNDPGSGNAYANEIFGPQVFLLLVYNKIPDE